MKRPNDAAADQMARELDGKNKREARRTTRRAGLAWKAVSSRMKAMRQFRNYQARKYEVVSFGPGLTFEQPVR